MPEADPEPEPEAVRAAVLAPAVRAVSVPAAESWAAAAPQASARAEVPGSVSERS